MKLENLWKKGCDFLGSKYSILGGAMSWVSEKNLVSSISNSGGGFGVIACGAMNEKLLEEEIIGTKQLTNKPFGVNLITMHPDLDRLIDVCIEQRITHIVLAGGLPKQIFINKIKEAGIKVILAPALVLAQKLVKSGVDAIIIEGNEAGGHIGPVSTSVLAQEILPFIQSVPVFVAGGIGRGEAIVNYLLMGASGCQLGTRFVCATESIAHENFKKIFIKSSARDALSSVQIDSDFPVIPVRSIKNEASLEFIEVQKKAIEDFRSNKLTKEEAQLQIEHYWAGALRRAVIDGDVKTGSVMAGQSVGMVTKIQSTEEIIKELVTQAEEYLRLL